LRLPFWRGTSRRLGHDSDRTDVVNPPRMVVLRATRKLLASLPVTTPSTAPSDTALGDWYVNRLVVDRRPLLLLVSGSSLLPIVVPARDVRRLPDYLPDLVAARLTRLGIAPRTIALETRAMSPVTIGTTVDRSVVGIMVDFAKCLPFYLDQGQWDDRMLPVVEDKLAETPCYAGRSSAQTVFPVAKAPELLRAKWEVNRS
jgi:hypothetical protein